MEEQTSFTEQGHEQLQLEEPFYNGSWERSGRGTASAVVLAFLIIGVIYFNGQAVVASLFLVFNMMSDHGRAPNGFFENLEYMADLQKQPIRIAVVVSQFCLMLAPTVWLIKRWHTKHVTQYVRYRKSSMMEILLAVAATVCFFPLNEALSNLVIRILNVPQRFLNIGQKVFTASSGSEFVWLIFVVAVTPAICEEFFFRGYAQRTLERTMGWKSILVTGVVFGLYHMQPLSLITLIGMGFLFGYLYYRSKSLFTSMSAHFTNNFLAIYFLYQGSAAAGWFRGMNTPLHWLTLIGSIALLCFILIVYHFITMDVREDTSIVEKIQESNQSAL